jgi:hypothetical protein
VTLINITDRWRHDMKNQIGIILGFSDLLLQEMAADDTRRPDVQEINLAARRVMVLLAEVAPPAAPEPEG